MVGMMCAGNDPLVDFDRNAAERKLKFQQQIGDGRQRPELAPLTVHEHANTLVHARSTVPNRAYVFSMVPAVAWESIGARQWLWLL